MFASDAQLTKTVLLVCGGRDYTRSKRLHRFLDRLARKVNIVKLVTGRCPTGTDKFAEEWAHKHNIPFEGYPADWLDLTTKPCIKRYREDGTPYNAAAGNARNKRMLRESKANLVVATEGRSGTADMIKIARTAGVQVLEVDQSNGHSHSQRPLRSGQRDTRKTQTRRRVPQ